MECPPAMVLHGPSGTGKSSLLRNFFDIGHMKYSVVSCDQCTTTRIMLQRAIRVVKKDSGQKDPMDEDKSLQTDLVGQQVGFDVVAENFSAFYATLSSFFKRTNYNDTHVLVLDRIDQLPTTQQICIAVFHGCQKSAILITSLLYLSSTL